MSLLPILNPVTVDEETEEINSAEVSSYVLSVSLMPL